MARQALVVVLLLSAATTLAGCLDAQRPIVNDDIVASSNHAWVVDRQPRAAASGLETETVETVYTYSPGEEDRGYPGVLVLVGIRAVARLDDAELLETARNLLDEEMDRQGVAADAVTQQDGSREIRSGVETSWIYLRGAADTGSILFHDAREIKMVAETWYDETSKMQVVAVAIAQTVRTDVVGQPQRDEAVWNEIVGDAFGSIGAAAHHAGFIDHVVIQD